MTRSDSLHIDEHLARLLAACDQEISGGDGKAATIDLPRPRIVPLFPLPDVPPADESIHKAAANGSSRESPQDHDPDRTRPDYPGIPPTAPTVQLHRIGRFELRRQLGKGGCGIVFLAFDPKLQREVALKIPRPEMLLSDDARRRLIREALAAAEFDHPNLVPVFESGEIGPVCFIASAFCPGQTLAEWLHRQHFPIPIRQTARLIAILAEAVQHAHDRGVLHRDLKPNNVLLQDIKTEQNEQGSPAGSCQLRGEQFVPRVVDFGLAKLAERGPSDTASRQILGTPKYMAPEQAQGRHEDVGPGVDVYALGVVLYEMLVGRAPYDGPNDVELLRLSIEGKLTYPRSIRRDIPRDLEAICLRAMARSPARRYRMALDLADDLRRFLDGRPTVARPLNTLGRAARWLRRNDQAVALVAVTSLALFFLGVGIWNTLASRQLRNDRDTALRDREERVRADRTRLYAADVRAAFLSWRAGDARQMAASLLAAKTAAENRGEQPCFAWKYLAQLGRAERMSFACPEGAATSLTVSPDGSQLATGHPDGTLSVWDRATGQRIGSVKAHPGAVTQVVFLADGKQVASAGGESVVRIWRLSPAGTLTQATAFPPLPDPVGTLIASPDRRILYAGSTRGDCLRWDVAVKSMTWKAGNQSFALAVSPDGKTLATFSRPGPVRLWAEATGVEEGRIQIRGPAVTALAFASIANRGWLLAAARRDGTVRLFDREGRETATLAGHAEPILALVASPDGSALASGGLDEYVCVWDVPTGALRALFRGHDKPVRAVRFEPDGGALLTAADDGLVKTWDLTADPEGQSLRDLNSGVSSVAYHADGKRFVVGYADGSVELYPHLGGPPRRFPADERRRESMVEMRFPEIGPPIGVELTSRAGVCWAFDDVPRELLRADTTSQAVATAAGLSEDGSRLVIGDERGRVGVWSVATRSRTAEFSTGLQLAVRHLTFAPSGLGYAAQTSGYQVGVWEADEPAPRIQVPGHGEGLWLVRFFPGGDRVVTAGRGSSIKVWNLTTRRVEQTLLGHIGRVTALAVSADGRTLVSGSATGEVKLWDLRTGLELLGLRRHTGPVTVAQFAPGGRLLVTGGIAAGGRGELAFWEAKE